MRWEVQVGDHVDARPDRRARADRQGRGGASRSHRGHHHRSSAARSATCSPSAPPSSSSTPDVAPSVAAPEPTAADRTLRQPGESVDGADPRASAGVVQAAPPVRKLARELGVDLAAVAGSGPSGRVTAADVRAAGAVGQDPVSIAEPVGTATVAAPVPVGSERREPLRGIRRAMARNMADAWREVPHISLVRRDRRAAGARRAPRRTGAVGRPLAHAHRVLRARVGAGARASSRSSTRASTPHATRSCTTTRATWASRWRPSTGSWSRSCTTRRRGRCGSSASEITRLTAAARAGGLPPDEIRGATFTVTNYGTEGGRFATPIVRPPQVGILGCGAIRVRPVVERRHRRRRAGAPARAVRRPPRRRRARRDRVPRRRGSPSRGPARAPRRTRLRGFRAAFEATGVMRGGH